eukprot:422115_1
MSNDYNVSIYSINNKTTIIAVIFVCNAETQAKLSAEFSSDLQNDFIKIIDEQNIIAIIPDTTTVIIDILVAEHKITDITTTNINNANSGLNGKNNLLITIVLICSISAIILLIILIIMVLFLYYKRKKNNNKKHEAPRASIEMEPGASKNIVEIEPGAQRMHNIVSSSEQGEQFSNTQNDIVEGNNDEKENKNKNTSGRWYSPNKQQEDDNFYPDEINGVEPIIKKEDKW